MEPAGEDDFDEGPLEVDSEDGVMRECAVCRSLLVWEGVGAPAAREAALALNGGVDLCARCSHARTNGSYAYACEACGEEAAGRLEDVLDCLNVGDGGHAWCRHCTSAFRGIWTEGNKALAFVEAAVAAGTVTRSGAARTQRQVDRLYEDEVRYKKVVRAMSLAAAKREPEAVNPRGLVGGHLDHVVPVVVCFDHRVPEAVAASVGNLLVVHRLVNIAKGANFEASEMVGRPARGSGDELDPAKP